MTVTISPTKSDRRLYMRKSLVPHNSIRCFSTDIFPRKSLINGTVSGSRRKDIEKNMKDSKNDWWRRFIEPKRNNYWPTECVNIDIKHNSSWSIIFGIIFPGELIYNMTLLHRNTKKKCYPSVKSAHAIY